MSRQNKQAKKLAMARSITALHKSGQRGAKSTSPKHNKTNTKWDSPETKTARANILVSSRESKTEKTVLEQINEQKQHKPRLPKTDYLTIHKHRDLQNQEM